MIEVHEAVMARTGGIIVVKNRERRVVGDPGVPFDVWFGQSRIQRVPGEVLNPLQPNVVVKPLPYAVYYGNVGHPSNRRLSGRSARRSVFWSISFVGESEEQTLAAGQALRDVLEDQRLVVPGHKMWLTSVEESQRVRRDDGSITPAGTFLFYGVDSYAAGVTLWKDAA